MTPEELKKDITDSMETFHQKNFYALYPSGGNPRPWVIEAFAAYAQPLHEEIARLKAITEKKAK